MTVKCAVQFKQFAKPVISHCHFILLCLVNLPSLHFPEDLATHSINPELPRQPGMVSPALFCYIFFGFSSTTHVINRESFYKKWDCPSSSWKHPWLTTLVTGKPCAALQHIQIYLFSPATSSLLLALQTLLRMLPVCCIQIKDQITWILHQVDILQILSWAERGTHLMCKTNNWPELSCSQSWGLWYPVPIL